MRSTNLFGKTLRQAPADAENISHKLLIRAGFIQQIAAGIFSLQPLGSRSITKIRNIIREEMMTTQSTTGKPGFSSKADAEGPVAGFDPVQKKMMKRKKRYIYAGSGSRKNWMHDDGK